ncbi:DsbA family oxidoreductase [Jatrophihabitans fulvus]
MTDDGEKSPTVIIEVWSDLVCPWCYLGKHRLQAALDERPDARAFTIRMRAFELDANASREPETVRSLLTRRYGAHMMQAEQQLKDLAEGEGLRYDLARLNANTSDVHRATAYATSAGRGYEFFSAVQDGFFAGTLDPYDPVALADVAGRTGLDRDRLRQVLDGDEFADRVRADELEARQLGVTGVPFVVVDRAVAAPGAQSVEVYGQLLDKALERRR